MSFTQNRLEFANDITYDEISNAMAYGKGVPSFVVKGLDLTGTTLTAGIFTNTGTFGQLGLAGETHTITANYTGYIVIKSTLNGVNSVSTIELSATRNDSDPTIVSNIKYFTIYKLNAGAIEEDYRHSSYVKNISFENVGGSNFVQNINGTKSNPFDASVFAGNRTLLDDKDIGYDDTIHDNTLLKDILKDIFDKTRTLIGTDKPFILNFDAGIGNVYNPNLGEALKELILNKYGYTIVGALFNFKWTAGTGAGFTRDTYSNLNKIELWSASSGFYFEFEWDYNAFDNVIVLDRNGAPHADLWADLRYFGSDTDGWSIDCPYRDYISGMTFRISDYDNVSGKYTNADVEIRYVPRVTTVSKPPNLSSGMADLVFDSSHSVLTSLQSSVNPIAITQIAQTYFTFGYGNETTPHPNGIIGYGLLESFHNDLIISAIVIHYGEKNWSIPENKLQFAPVTNWEPPALKVETPNIEPEIDNGVRGDK